MSEKTSRKNFLEKGGFDLPKLEEDVLGFWTERNIFEKSLEKNAGAGAKKQFVFYEGPPYANGKPAIHHVLARVVKDVILRYKTMRGYNVPRRAGWDTHGLPVEMAAEKALGFKTKRDIEKFGVKRFNEEAKKQVWIHKDEWERLTNRIGYWLDLKNAYVTYAPEYIESIWWTLAEISRRGLLYKGHKVVPWCTRCGTALSSHELAQGYKEVSDRSVYVKFKLKPGQKIGNHTIKPDDKIYILSWTTTPWTLPGNVALAVGSDIRYRAVEHDGEYLIAAVDRLETLGLPPGDDSREFTGAQLAGAEIEYEPLFEVAPLQKPAAYKVYAADFVTTTDGTGVVHTAVMYGEDDYELGKKIGLPQHHTVDEEGNFAKDVPAFSGMYVKAKETEDAIFEHLRAHGNLVRIEEYKHEYPFCWRCGTPILYYARTSWFIGMSKLRDELLKRNKTIHWMPEHVRDGRFGEWLREVKDWNLSRERYWGAPLPIWECAKCGRMEVVESTAQLSEFAGGAKNKYWIMRHGEAESNTLKIVDSGTLDIHLTAKGRTQTKAAAKKIQKLLGKKKIDVLFSSDVQRAKETLAILDEELGLTKGGTKIVFDKRLREMNLGPKFDGKPAELYWSTYPTYQDRFESTPEGGESRRDIRKRVWDFLRECEENYEGKNIFVLSHGDPLLMFMQVAFGFSEKAINDRHDEFYPETAHCREIIPLVIPRDDTGLIDLHRPYVDEVVFPCGAGDKKSGKCDGNMKRVREVADVWYDSGAMPYAQDHFPFDGDALPADGVGSISARSKKKELYPPAFPADYIAEGMDQTRGWFYTLLAIATALGYEAPYRNVITFGLMNDKFGNKMSKSKGNVIEPFPIIEKYGVDAVRWYFYAGTPFGEPKNFDEAEVGKKLRQVHLIIYNSFVFWRTYGDHSTAPVRLGKDALKNAKNPLDAWIIARFSELSGTVTKKLDAYEIREAAFNIESFVDDLSRWYIRRSRKRLQRPEDQADYKAASDTLGTILRELLIMMAPFTPFFSEILHSAMGGGKESVHLEDWLADAPKLSADAKQLIQEMGAVRELAAAGLAKRAEAKLKVRQPLASMTIKTDIRKGLQSILADEVNVKEIKIDAKAKEEATLDTALTPELRAEGIVREIARMAQELRQKAALEPKDRIVLLISGSDTVRDAIQKYEQSLKSDVGAKAVEYKESDKFDAEERTELDGQAFWIALRKL